MPGETEADNNIQALADFIEQGKQGNNEPTHYVDLPNTAPLVESGLYKENLYQDSHFFIHVSSPIVVFQEMINTEQHEVIGWRHISYKTVTFV